MYGKPHNHFVSHRKNNNKHDQKIIKTTKARQNHIEKENQKQKQKQKQSIVGPIIPIVPTTGVVKDMITSIPRLVSKKTTKILNDLFKKEHDAEYVWIIRPKFNYTYFSIRDETNYTCVIAFHDKSLANDTMKAIVDYEIFQDQKNILKKARQPLIIEHLSLSFLQQVCDSTSLNLIVFYKDEVTKEIILKKFWFPKDPSEDIRMHLENIIKY